MSINLHWNDSKQSFWSENLGAFLVLGNYQCFVTLADHPQSGDILCFCWWRCTLFCLACFCSERTLESESFLSYILFFSLRKCDNWQPCHFPLKLTLMPHFAKMAWMHIQVLPNHHNPSMTKSSSSSSSTMTNSAVCRCTALLTSAQSKWFKSTHHL